MWKDYADIDSALLTSEEPTDRNIVQNINAKEQLESGREEEVEEEPLLIAEEALKTAELLSRFVHRNIKNHNLSMAMSSIRNCIRDCYYNKMKKQNQTKITDFLSKNEKYTYIHVLSAILFLFNILCFSIKISIYLKKRLFFFTKMLCMTSAWYDVFVGSLRSHNTRILL